MQGVDYREVLATLRAEEQAKRQNKEAEWIEKNQRPEAYNNLYISEQGSILRAHLDEDPIRMENLHTKQSTLCSEYYINFMSRPITLDKFTEKEIFTMMLTGKVIRKDND
jgi:hypothetical protein